MKLKEAEKMRVGDKVCLVRGYFRGAIIGITGRRLPVWIDFAYGKEYEIKDIADLGNESPPHLVFYLANDRERETAVHYSWLRKSK